MSKIRKKRCGQCSYWFALDTNLGHCQNKPHYNNLNNQESFIITGINKICDGGFDPKNGQRGHTSDIYKSATAGLLAVSSYDIIKYIIEHLGAQHFKLAPVGKEKLNQFFEMRDKAYQYIDKKIEILAKLHENASLEHPQTKSLKNFRSIIRRRAEVYQSNESAFRHNTLYMLTIKSQNDLSILAEDWFLVFALDRYLISAGFHPRDAWRATLSNLGYDIHPNGEIFQSMPKNKAGSMTA